MTRLPIILPPEVSGKILSEALEAYGVEDPGYITSFAAAPFEAVYISEDDTCTVWEKDFKYRGKKNITRAIFVEYLAYLMPELYNVSCDVRGNATLAWATRGTDSLTLGEGVTGLSSDAIRIINAELTLEQLWEAFYTDVNTAKISKLMSGPHIEADAIVRTIMADAPLSMAHGEL
jgi:hypothetical protein